MEKDKLPEPEIEYMNRCLAVCEKLGVRLVGWTTGSRFSFDYPEHNAGQIHWGHEQVSHRFLVRMENLINGIPNDFTPPKPDPAPTEADRMGDPLPKKRPKKNTRRQRG